jgi:hypothetical protein
MSQTDYPGNQDSGKLQTLAVEVGKVQATLEHMKDGIEEMKGFLASISKERLDEARDWGSLENRVSNQEAFRKFTIGWLSGLSLVAAAALFSRYMK